MKKKSDIEINQIIDLYNKGNSCKKIEEITNIPYVTVYNILKRNNINMRTKGGIKKLDKDYIINKYKNEHISSTKIAKEFNVTPNTIIKILHENNIKIINNKDIYKNNSLDQNYFDKINKNEKAYFLGLLLTDGCIHKKPNRIALDLASKDDYIIKLFSDCIHNKNKLYYRKSKNTTRICFVSEKMKNDLSKYNIIPNKTFTADMPNNIPEKYMSHFIRGLIDGDGWISEKSHTIGFCGNEKIVTSVRDFLVKTLNVYPVKVMHADENVYQISWASKKDIILIGQYIYKNKSKYHLKRKYKNYMAIPR